MFRYRDRDTGRWVGEPQMQAASRASIRYSQDKAYDAGLALGEGDVTLGAWQRGMRNQIKDEYVRQYLLGRGGRDQMTPRDWGLIGAMVKEQYHYLDRMTLEAMDGMVSARQLAARSQMYVNSAREALERAKAETRGIPELPAYPGDGSTICLTNCMCSWVYRRRGGQWRAYWTLSPVESCDTCIERGGTWNPYVP